MQEDGELALDMGVQLSMNQVRDIQNAQQNLKKETR
jgi:hypothetical protein